MSNPPAEANLDELFCVLFGEEGVRQVSMLATNDLGEVKAGIVAWLSGEGGEEVARKLPARFNPPK